MIQIVKRAFLIFFVAASFYLALGAKSIVASDPPELPTLELQVIPSILKVPWQGEVEVLVVARNLSNSALQDMQLSWLPNMSIRVTAVPTTSQDMLPYGTLAWTLRIARQGKEPFAGPIHLRVDYTWQGERNEVAAVTVGTLTIAIPETQSVDQVIQVQVETAMTTLMRHRPGTIHLVVSNISDVPVQIINILADAPAFVEFKLPSLGTGVTLDPGETHTFDIDVEVPKVVQPGKHLLLLKVPMEWEHDGRVWKASAVVAREMTAGVIGESEILTALGIPSLLVLPGFLMVIVWSVLWRYVKPKKEFPFEAKSPEFWLFAITLSLLAAFIYPTLTRWFSDVEQNYLQSYSLVDLGWIWNGSIAFVVVVYTLCLLMNSAWQRWWVQKRVPAVSDIALAILRKLQKQGLSFQVRTAQVTLAEKPCKVYLLEPLKEERAHIWVSPRICVHWIADSIRPEDRLLQQRIENLLDGDGDVKKLVDLLETGQEQGVLQIKWEHIGEHTGPFQVETRQLLEHLLPGKERIVRQE